jgi:hypothetical protein
MPRKRKERRKIAAGYADYLVECYKRSKRRAFMVGLMRKKGAKQILERLDLLWETVKRAPVFPINTDGTNWITVKIDLWHPAQVVLAEVENLLEKLRDDPEELLTLRDYGALLEEILCDLRARPGSALARALEPVPKRIHGKTLQLRLDIWDLAQKGLKFNEIAKKIKKRPSTVRDLYNQAALDICGQLPPKKWRLRLLQTFVPETHDEICPQCRAAQRVQDFCAAKRAYVNREYVSLRERPTENIAEIPAERPYPGWRKQLRGAD